MHITCKPTGRSGDRRPEAGRTSPRAKHNSAVSERSLKPANRPPGWISEALPGPANLWFLMTEGEGCSPERCLLAWTFKRK